MTRLAGFAALVVGCTFTPQPAPTGGDDDDTPINGDAGPGVDTPPPPPDAPEPDAPPGISVTSHASVADTFLASEAPNDNFSTQTSMLADGEPVRHALIRFDLSAIPTTTTVISAELRIWTGNDDGTACTFFAVLEAWDESSTSWNQRMTGVNWSAAGATPPSRSTTAAGTVVPTIEGVENIVAIDTAVVAGWVANPATNFGFAIVSSSADGARLTTKEGIAGTQPHLVVTHSP